MKQIRVRTSDGKSRLEVIYNVADFPYKEVYTKLTVSKNFIKYMNVIATFDIETTTVKIGDKYEGFMYVWQFSIMNHVVMGRTWGDYKYFIERLQNMYHLGEKRKLVVYVHNLSFEFQFLWRFFEWDNIFAKDRRKVLKACDTNGIEYRCSYFLTNMSLARACKNVNALYYKKDGEEFDYSMIRTPETCLTQKELEYCFCDVRGLSEVIEDFLKDDTFATIPLTSTGFVRRDCRNAMRKNPENRKMFLNTALTKEQYIMLEEAKRGGNTHANRHYALQTIENVQNVDSASSYPFQMMVFYYPMSTFMQVAVVQTLADMKQYTDHFCCLFRIAFENLRIKSNDVPVPYIPYHKLTRHSGKDDVVFNGRVLYSPACQMTLTEIDWQIISEQYTWDRAGVADFYIAERGDLPVELKEQIMHYFYGKTTLKKADPYLYIKSKNKVNSIFGMACTNPVHDEYLLSDEGWETVAGDIESELEKYYKSRNSFLPIQWGVWVTAHARKWLQYAINVTGDHTLYNDTDGDKYIGLDPSVFDGINKYAIRLCEKNHAYVDFKGKRYYMGVYEPEPSYEKFRTCGSKKYCAIQDGKVKITVAGVHKEKGAKYLSDHGGIEAFKPGFLFPDQRSGGGTESHWNDDPIHRITVDGVEIINGANVGITDSSYRLGVTDEFLENQQFNVDDLLVL